jgi:tyrosyl-tRNA synthetase
MSLNLKEVLDGAEIVIPDDVIKEKLALSEKEGRPLIVKLGCDPTSPDLHIGHSVVFKKMKLFQDAGHKIVIIIGDFTALIGDPSGRNKTRPPLSEEQIENNAKTYIEQLGKVLDVSKIEVRRNSEWFGGMTMSDTIKLLASYNLGRMLVRDDFKKRFESEIPIAMHELLYPLLQGYDSIMIHADIEIGGTDQLFNLQVGRYLQETYGLPAQGIMCMPLLRGLDGVHKMSKSLGNYIALTDEPKEMFGKVMSTPDDLLPEYINLTTDFSVEEKSKLLKRLESENPIEIKKIIAKNLVKQYHDQEQADEAEQFFYNQFQNKNKDTIEYVEVKVGDLGIKNESSIVDLLIALSLVGSKSEARRLIEQGGVTINGEKIKDSNFNFQSLESFKLTVGKQNFYQIIL